MRDFSASWKPVTFLSCDKLSDYMWFHSQKSQEVTLTQVTGGLIDWLIDVLTDWLMDWLTDWWIDWLIDGLTDWLMNWLTDWWIDWLIDELTDWLMDWLTDWWIDWLIDGLTDWLLEWLTDWGLTDWLRIDWLTDGLTDWWQGSPVAVSRQTGWTPWGRQWRGWPSRNDSSSSTRNHSASWAGPCTTSGFLRNTGVTAWRRWKPVASTRWKRQCSFSVFYLLVFAIVLVLVRAPPVKREGGGGE